MEFCCKSDIGLVRPENQDRVTFIQKDDWALAVLCDGMGGHRGGAQAASLTIDIFSKYFTNNFPFSISYNDKFAINEWFSQALSHIKSSMREYVEEHPQYRDMGTTLVAALIYQKENHIYIFNIGDSRIYIYNGLLHQVTQDQNMLNKLINEGFNPTDASKHPDANKLTSCLGPYKVMVPDGHAFNRNSNSQYIILTSDGLHDFIEKPLFERVIQNKKNSLEEKALNLINYAKKNHSNDNISIIIVRV